MLDKTALRHQLLAQRRALPAPARARRDHALATHLHALLQERMVQCLGVYWPIQGEPDLRPTYAVLAQRGIQLALPAVVQSDAPLAFFAWTPGDALERDACGVPAPSHRTQTLQPQALLIPCVGFDRHGFRLGYGAGYYDRTLAAPPRPFTIGIAYADQLAAFASGAHDIALDVVLTEAGQTAPCPDG